MMLSTSLMSDDDRPQLSRTGTGTGSGGEFVDMGDTDAEFELDVDVLIQMREREAQIQAEQQEEEKKRQQKEQQLALQQRYQLLQEEALRAQREQQAAAGQERMSDEEDGPPSLSRDVSSMSTASTTSTVNEPSGKGYVTVVDVKIQPHRLSPRSSTAALADVPLVDVRLHVFQRFVPHIAAAALTIRRVSQSHAEYIKQMEAEDGYSSDTSSEGTEDEDAAEVEQAKPLHLTGDRQIDAAMLRKLIGVASDESDTDSDVSELRAVNSTRTTMHEDDEDDEGVSAASPLRTKHELAPAAVPVPPFTVSPTDALVYAGTVTAIVDAMLVVQCQLGGRALDLGSAVCMENRTALGRVDEVFGPVSEPMYSIRPLEGVDVVKCGLVEGMRVCSVPSLSTYVLPDTTPGSDASNLFDEEVETELQEYSDDEQEQAAKSKKKRAKGKNNNASQQSSGRVLPQEPASKSPRYRFAPSSNNNNNHNGQHNHAQPSAPAPPVNYPPQHSQQQPHPYYPPGMYYPQQQPHPPPYNPAAGYSPYTPLQRPGFYAPPPGMPHPAQYAAYQQPPPANGVTGWQYPHAAVSQPQVQQSPR